MTKARDLADLLDSNGNLIAKGVVDGRDLATDGSKLDGIEAAATADQDHSEIRALITIGVDTNVFTDADHTKLDGIEANATADQTAAQLLTAIKTVDGAGSGLSADLLDGQQGSYYTGYTDTAVSNLVDSSPGTLNTLNELAAALGDDANFSTTVTNSIAAKLPLSGGTITGNLSVTGTVDGVDIAARDAILTSTTTTANAALPLAGGTVTGQIAVSNSAPSIKLNDTSANADDFTLHANSNNFYVLADRDDDGGHETPHPLQLEGDTNIGYVFGSRMFHQTYHPNADTLTTARTINGVSFDGSANITVPAVDSTKLPLSGGTLTGDLAVSNNTPVLSINDTGNGDGGGFIGHIEFNNTSGESFRIGDWAAVNETDGPDVLRLRNSNGTKTVFEWGQAGTTAGSLYAYNQRVFADNYHPNADTLTTARNINGVAFNGSANITVADATKLPLAGGTLTGDLTIPNKIIHAGDTDTYFQFSGANLARMFIAGAAVQEWGSNYTRFNDNDTVRLGTDADFRMLFDGTNTLFRNYAHAGGNIIFQGEDTEGTNHALLYMMNDLARPYLRLFENGGERLRTLAGGVGVTGLTVGAFDAAPHNAGGLYVTNTNNEKIVLAGSAEPYIRFQEGTTDKAYIQWNDDGFLDFRNQETGMFKFQSTVDGNASQLVLMRNDTSTTSGQDLGSINFGHTDGTPDFPAQTIVQLPVRIVAEATETTSGVDDGARLRFYTKANDVDKAVNSIESMRLEHNGDAIFYHELSVPNTIFHSGDTNTHMQFSAADTWRVVTGGTPRLTVTNSGATVAGTFNNTSDARLKENVAPLTNALSDVCKLEGVSFNWIDGGKKSTGFIAQQVEPILPDVVTTSEDDGTKSVNYVGMIGHLVEAIKEQQAQIDELKSKLNG